jgi:solute carrier family 25 phosphate transporter 3
MFNPLKFINQQIFSNSVDKVEKKAPKVPGLGFMASPHEQGPFDLTYFLKGGLAGGLCCGITHGALCPVDVVKTRIQLDPIKYNRGMLGGFRQVIAEEGVMALSTGLGPTAVGYFIQGWFKFGGVEFFKIQFAQSLGEERAWANKTPIYLASAAMAEFIADIFLCPLEATRIRLVSNPEYASGLLTAFPKIMKNEGIINGFYSGFGPILFKQIPYTMAKFSVQAAAADVFYGLAGTSPQQAEESFKMAISLSSGVVAGVASAIISHPADTLLSLVNKEGAGGSGTIMQRLFRLAGEMGFKKLCLVGLGPRCVMIGSLTAGQFGIYDLIMNLTGAQKFHFTNPNEKASHH